MGKARMLVLADVIGGEIGEDHRFKVHTLHAILHQCLRGNLNDCRTDTALVHIAKGCLKRQCVGRGVDGGNVLVGIGHTVGSDITAGDRRAVENL